MGERIRKPEQTREGAVEESTVKSLGDKAVSGEKVKAELDDLLDEIDGVLESNADDFVKNYIQKGGQ
jgi:ubiquitin-like protein Pup